MYHAFVYILASRRNGTLYIGVTNHLVRRIGENREGSLPGFTKQYRVHHLVWFEPHDSVTVAIQRETNLKRWPRRWKTELIERTNPAWRDLWEDIVG